MSSKATEDQKEVDGEERQRAGRFIKDYLHWSKLEETGANVSDAIAEGVHQTKETIKLTGSELADKLSDMIASGEHKKDEMVEKVELTIEDSKKRVTDIGEDLIERIEMVLSDIKESAKKQFHHGDPQVKPVTWLSIRHPSFKIVIDNCVSLL